MARGIGPSRQDQATPLVLVAAMILGMSLNGMTHSSLVFLHPLVDLGIFLVITAIMLGVRTPDLRGALKKRKATALALTTNFVIIPGIAWLLGWAFLRHSPDLWIGLVLYALTPCVGWYLIFIDAAQGDVAWGATLLPWNLGLQIVLMPLYLWLLVGHVLYLNPWTLLQSVGLFFVAPFGVGWGLQRGILRRWGETTFQGPIKAALGPFKLWALVVVIIALFASQPPVKIHDLLTLLTMVGTIFVFFVVMFLLALVNGAWAHLSYEDNVTLTFTTTARNSEVVIGVAMAAFPGHPLVYMAILVGPLVELPVLLLMAQGLVRLRPVLWPRPLPGIPTSNGR